MTWTIVIAASVAIGISAVGAAVTTIGPWYRGLRKPSWQPPDWLFGPAWTVILGLAAAAGVLAWNAAATHADQVRVIALFSVNGSLHMLWSALFFKLRRPDWSLIETVFLWLSILSLIVGLAPLSRTASLLLLPYILWVTFAGVLNRAIVRLNPSFQGA